jgi:hypothetical protein
MEPTEILTTLQTLNISIDVNGDKLVLTPGSMVPPELVPEIREHKAELLALVRPPSSETELRQLLDCTYDPRAFAGWFQWLMAKTDPAEECGSEIEHEQ